MDEIKTIIEKRMSLWKSIKKPEGYADPSLVPKDRRGGNLSMRGIHIDGSGITISVSPISPNYPNEPFDEGVLYCYPETKAEGLDASEIKSTEKCLEDTIPIFVILPENAPPIKAPFKTARLGWVMVSDDKDNMFLIGYGDEQP